LYANTAFQRTTGYVHEEIVGHNESILSYRVTPNWCTKPCGHRFSGNVPGTVCW
jgi:hypothetical protein